MPYAELEARNGTSLHFFPSPQAGGLHRKLKPQGLAAFGGCIWRTPGRTRSGLQEQAGTVGGWVELSGGPGGTTLILSIPLGPLRKTEACAMADERVGDDPTLWGGL